MSNFFVGIDPSLTGTGLIILNDNAEIIEQQLISTKHDSSNIYDIEVRILQIIDKISFILNIKNLYGIYMENISWASKGEAFAQLASLNYAIRVFLYQNKILYNVIPPTSLKKYVANSGSAKKNLMLKEVYKRWGVDLNDDNLADAYGLARMALENFNNGIFNVNKSKKLGK